jgi:ketosteroid isomerase-like protein
MSQENVEIVRRAFEQWQDGGGTVDAIPVEAYAENVEWDLSGYPLVDLPSRGSGRDNLLRTFAEYLRGWKNYEPEAREFIASGVAMSRENVEIVRAAYERFAQGKFSWDETAEDFEFVTSPELPDAGTYRGEAARRWLAVWVESFEGLTIEATEIIDADDKVFVAIHQHGRPRGSEGVVEGDWWQVITIREGEIVRSEVFNDRVEALEAAGLSE